MARRWGASRVKHGAHGGGSGPTRKRYHSLTLANRTPAPGHESEWLTRKRRIDPLLDAAGWPTRKGRSKGAYRTEEEETAHGPADYALWLDDRIVGIVEAKKLTIGAWMGRVLRGRRLPLERCLGALADAMRRQLPRHMVQLPGSGGPSHNVVVPAFIAGESRLYTIDLALAPNRKSYRFRYTRHVVSRPAPAAPRPPPLPIGGSGALYLNRDTTWTRGLLRLVRAYDRRRLTSDVVADLLAGLNNMVHQGVADGSVGPRCIVTWRNRKEGIHKGGGGHHFYTGTSRDRSSPCLPAVVGNGMDLQALVGVMMPRLERMFAEMRAGTPVTDLNADEINAELARLPDTPDEDLR